MIVNQKIETNAFCNKKNTHILCKNFIKNAKMPMVLSYDDKNKIFEYKNIINATYFESDHYKILTCGNRKIICSNKYLFFTDSGWINSYDLSENGIIYTTPPLLNQILRKLNDDQYQILLGSFLGDGHIANHGKHRYRLKITHGENQSAYCKWKCDMFQSNLKYIAKNGYSQKPAVGFISKMFGLKNEFPKIKTSCPQWVLNDLDMRGISILFMDDGSTNKNRCGARISTCSFDEDSQIRIVNKFKSLGIDCKYSFFKAKNHNKNGYYYIIFNSKQYKKLCEKMEPYFHTNLEYKIIKNTQNEKYQWNNKFENNGLTVIDKIEYISEKIILCNLKIENNNNFIICAGGKNPGGIITKIL